MGTSHVTAAPGRMLDAREVETIFEELAALSLCEATAGNVARQLVAHCEGHAWHIVGVFYVRGWLRIKAPSEPQARRWSRAVAAIPMHRGTAELFVACLRSVAPHVVWVDIDDLMTRYFLDATDRLRARVLPAGYKRSGRRLVPSSTTIGKVRSAFTRAAGRGH
jgi:hypothetical protein